MPYVRKAPDDHHTEEVNHWLGVLVRVDALVEDPARLQAPTTQQLRRCPSLAGCSVMSLSYNTLSRDHVKQLLTR